MEQGGELIHLQTEIKALVATEATRKADQQWEAEG